MEELELYTLGYAEWTLDEVAEAVHAHNAVLTDVRQNPQTSKPGFSRTELEKRLGNRYRHVSAFGNVNYKNGPIELADPEEGAEIVLGYERDPILMCGCKLPEGCHRSVVAKFLHERTGANIIHLRAPDSRNQRDLFED